MVTSIEYAAAYLYTRVASQGDCAIIARRSQPVSMALYGKFGHRDFVQRANVIEERDSHDMIRSSKTIPELKDPRSEAMC